MAGLAATKRVVQPDAWQRCISKELTTYVRKGGGTYKMLRVETGTKIRNQCADDVPSLSKSPSNVPSYHAHPLLLHINSILLYYDMIEAPPRRL